MNIGVALLQKKAVMDDLTSMTAEGIRLRSSSFLADYACTAR
jgi:hypothetical protein